MPILFEGCAQQKTGSGREGQRKRWEYTWGVAKGAESMTRVCSRDSHVAVMPVVGKPPGSCEAAYSSVQSCSGENSECSRGSVAAARPEIQRPGRSGCRWPRPHSRLQMPCGEKCSAKVSGPVAANTAAFSSGPGCRSSVASAQTMLDSAWE